MREPDRSDWLATELRVRGIKRWANRRDANRIVAVVESLQHKAGYGYPVTYNGLMFCLEPISTVHDLPKGCGRKTFYSIQDMRAEHGESFYER